VALNDYGLGCETVYFCRYVPTFRKNIMSPSSGERSGRNIRTTSYGMKSLVV
jgi:hypothetical protein